MSPPVRPLLLDLADDLDWLERHARMTAEAGRATPLRFAAALVRNLIGPFLSGVMPPPLHLAVVGGAGTGKSTVVNLLCGSAVAESNPQAGFTRHPVAYTRDGTSGWPVGDGFLGPLRARSTPGPANLDEDYYQVRARPAEPGGAALNDFAVWDCPDMTTWAACGYVPRLLEVAGLADVIVYVASDERYNDAVPTEFLRLFLEAGKPVIVVLTKMQPDHVEDLKAHFKSEVFAGMPHGRVAVLAVPHLTHDELADPAEKAACYRIPLVNQVAVFAEDPPALRSGGTRSAVSYLRRSADGLLSVAQDDLRALDEWEELVRRGRSEFEERYRREYLTGAKFHRFDEALLRLIDLLEIPGAGKFVSTTLYVVRTPYRLLKGLVGKILGPPSTAAIPEQPVLDAAFAAWVDTLRATALAHEKKHDLWVKLGEGFEGGLTEELTERYRQGLRDFQASQTDEIDRTARAIYEDLERSPGTLKTLRGSKLALDVAAVGASLIMGGLNWHDVILVPLAASVSQQLVEWAGAGYVEAQKEKARQRQLELVAHHMSRPLADWLVRWPTTGGTSYERMKKAVTRVPEVLARLDDAVNRVPA